MFTACSDKAEALQMKYSRLKVILYRVYFSIMAHWIFTAMDGILMCIPADLIALRFEAIDVLVFLR